MAGPGSYWLGEEEKNQVLEVLAGGQLMRVGDLDDPRFAHKVFTLEQEFAQYVGVPYVLATNSGTSALLCCLMALGLKPGDEVLVPAYTFVASYSSAAFLGLVPILCEVDESLTLDPRDLERRITPRTRAIMAVHMLGNPCDMDAIQAIAARRGLLVIEDACQAAGASYRGRKVGSLGDMAGFSLNVFKTITAGDGGLLTARTEGHYRLAFGVHDQGHSPLRAEVEEGRRSVLGLNFRMNEVTGAVALAQLRKIDRILGTLRQKKSRFKDQITGIPGTQFRKLNDPAGECGTLLTVLFDEADRAASVARALGTRTVDRSGWHVYANMEHVNRYLKEHGLPHGKGAYPRTDDILSRAINLSVGVVDAGLGAAFGININSTDAEIAAAAARFRKACGSHAQRRKSAQARPSPQPSPSDGREREERAERGEREERRHV
jgi:dTDP-4-amino-4,6-dideoxygalactose transaminase